MSRRSSIVSSRSSKSQLPATTAPPKSCKVETLKEIDGDCKIFSSVVGYGWLGGEGVFTENFTVSDEVFSLQTTIDSNQKVNMKLFCHTASTKRPVYAQCKLGFIAMNGSDRHQKLLHCLFQKSPPWGRTLQIMTLEKNSPYTAIRRLDSSSEPTLSLKLDFIVKVIAPIGGEYYIQKLPEIETPSETGDLSNVMDGGLWGTACAQNMSVDTESDSVTVVDPVWGYHCAFWSRGINSVVPAGGVAKMYEFEVEVTHPSEDSFGILRVGIIPRLCFCQGTNAVLDFVAAIDQEGTSYVAQSSERFKNPNLFGENCNTATITVRVDQLNQQIYWKVNDNGWTAPMSLESLIRIASGDEFVPFVMMNYKDDIVKWIRGGTIPFPNDDASVALEVQNAVQKIFEFADRNDDGQLDDNEIILLSARTTNKSLESLSGTSPRFDDLLFFYSTQGGAAADSAMLEHRMDPNSQLFAAKPCFSDQSLWDTAEIENIELPEKAKRLHPETGELKTRQEFLETHTEDDWFAAAMPAEGDNESLPGDTAISINPNDL